MKVTLSEKRVSQSVLQTTKYKDIKIIRLYKAAACVSVCESVMGAATRTNLLSSPSPVRIQVPNPGQKSESKILNPKLKARGKGIGLGLTL